MTPVLQCKIAGLKGKFESLSQTLAKQPRPKLPRAQAFLASTRTLSVQSGPFNLIKSMKSDVGEKDVRHRGKYDEDDEARGLLDDGNSHSSKEHKIQSSSPNFKFFIGMLALLIIGIFMTVFSGKKPRCQFVNHLCA